MNIDQQKLLNRLDKIPIGKPISEESKKVENNHININMSKNIHNSSAIIICVTICAALIVIASLYAIINIIPMNQSKDAPQIQIITSIQADEIKELVKAVASCRNESPLRIHAELKKMFGYYQYSMIDTPTYNKVMMYLKSQTCQLTN